MRIIKRVSTALLGILLIFSSVLNAETNETAGLLVETIGKGNLRAAELAPGDILIGWRASKEGNAPKIGDNQSTFKSLFDWSRIQIEQGPVGPFELFGSRGGTTRTWFVSQGEWDSTILPAMKGPELQAFELVKEISKGDSARLSNDSILLISQLERSEISSWLFSYLADSFSKSGQFKAATELYLRALKISDSETDSVFIRLALAKNYQASGEIDESLSSYETALSEADSIFGECMVSANIHHKIGNLQYTKGNYPVARSHFEAALATRIRFAPSSQETATSLANLGVIAYRRGDLEEAESLQLRALEIRERLSADGLALADSYLNLGAVASAQNDYDKALGYYRQALAIAEKHDPISLLTADVLNNLGNVAWATGDLDSAELLHRNSLAIRKTKAPGSLDLADSYNNLGLIFEARKDLATAEDYYLQSLEIIKEMGDDSLAFADSLSNLGGVAELRFDLDRAFDYHSRALEIRKRDAPGSQDESAALNNLGVIEHKRGNLAQAESLFAGALKIKEKFNRNGLDYALGLGNLGGIAADLGRPKEAIEYLSKSISIRESIAPNSMDLARDLSSLGRAYALTGNLSKELEVQNKALGIAMSISPESEEVAVTLNRIGRINQATRGNREATDYFIRSVAAFEGQMSQFGSSDSTRNNFRASRKEIYTSAIQSLADSSRPDEAFLFSEKYRARGFSELLANSGMISPDTESARLRLQRTELANRFDAVTGKISAGGVQLAETLRIELDAIIRRRNELLDASKGALSVNKSHQMARPTLSHLEISKYLNKRSLLLSYIVSKDITYLFSIQPDGVLTVHQIKISEADLRRTVHDFRKIITRTATPGHPEFSDFTIRQGRTLFALLFEPIESLLQNYNRLLIIPDGPLHQLPFGALVIGNRGYLNSELANRFVAERWSTHFTLSGSIFANLNEAPRITKEVPRLIAIFGAPAISGSSEELTSITTEGPDGTSATLAPLPEARSEAIRISEVFVNSAVFLGSGASERNVKLIGEGADIIHFATHANLDNREPMYSSLLLSSPLSPSNIRENGQLQAWEIYDELRLKADLVVLSACETGLGDELGGEGLIGLTRAFQFAGARTVVASLWKVPDASTSELMISFYRHLNAGLPKDESLRAAQVELMQQTTENGGGRPDRGLPPFYWAAFQVYGDWQ